MITDQKYQMSSRPKIIKRLTQELEIKVQSN